MAVSGRSNLGLAKFWAGVLVATGAGVAGVAHLMSPAPRQALMTPLPAVAPPVAAPAAPHEDGGPAIAALGPRAGMAMANAAPSATAAPEDWISPWQRTGSSVLALLPRPDPLPSLLTSATPADAAEPDVASDLGFARPSFRSAQRSAFGTPDGRYQEASRENLPGMGAAPAPLAPLVPIAPGPPLAPAPAAPAEAVAPVVAPPPPPPAPLLVAPIPPTLVPVGQLPPAPPSVPAPPPAPSAPAPSQAVAIPVPAPPPVPAAPPGPSAPAPSYAVAMPVPAPPPAAPAIAPPDPVAPSEKAVAAPTAPAPPLAIATVAPPEGVVAALPVPPVPPVLEQRSARPRAQLAAIALHPAARFARPRYARSESGPAIASGSPGEAPSLALGSAATPVTAGAVPAMLAGAGGAVAHGEWDQARQMLMHAETRLVFASDRSDAAPARTLVTSRITDALASLHDGPSGSAREVINDAARLSRGLD